MTRDSSPQSSPSQPVPGWSADVRPLITRHRMRRKRRRTAASLLTGASIALGAAALRAPAAAAQSHPVASVLKAGRVPGSSAADPDLRG